MIERSAVPEPRPGVAPVVVGVGTEEVGAALRFAVEEAARTGSVVHLFHVVPVVPVGSDEAVRMAEELDKLGRETLSLAAERAEELAAGQVVVLQELRRGPAIPVLVAASASARMIVLEHQHPADSPRAVTRTTAGGVAALAEVPVVSVPGGWAPSSDDRVVTVGVDSPIRAGEVLRAASDQAASRRATLRAVHAWSLPGPYESLHADTTEDRRWGQRARAEVRAALDEVATGEVRAVAEVLAHRGRAVDALLDASEGADLLVIGRHDPYVPTGSHIGPVARAVLLEATCPVLLAAPRPRR